MGQDDLFFRREGDNWFRRNRDALDTGGRMDWPTQLVGMMAGQQDIRSVVELGCSNGYRLANSGDTEDGLPIRRDGCEPRGGRDGRERYLDRIPPRAAVKHSIGGLRPVIVRFVLHWVDRRTLARSISEIDRVTRDGGVLVLGTFCPTTPRRAYHHLPEAGVFTYKQDYARIFEALGTYREFARIAFDHSGSDEPVLQETPSADRGYCVLLKKSLEMYYPEV
jgi:SAM-dependent methyltransferase